MGKDLCPSTLPPSPTTLGCLKSPPVLGKKVQRSKEKVLLYWYYHDLTFMFSALSECSKLTPHHGLFLWGHCVTTVNTDVNTLASSNASLSADQFCSSPLSYSLGFFIWHHHHQHPAEATSPITPGQKQGTFPFIINLGQLYPHACSTSVPQKTHILDSGHWK